MQQHLHIIKIITLALCCFLLSGCAGQAMPQPAQSTPEAARMQPLGTPAPTPVTIDKNSYKINEDNKTFTLKRTIIPKEGVPPMLLIVSGIIDESDYWLLGERLTITDDMTDQILQTYTLKRGRMYEPFWILTKQEAEKRLNEWPPDESPPIELIIEDLNFDGWLDFRICLDSGIRNTFYWYWLWNPASQLFEKSMELENLHLSSAEFFQEEQYFTSINVDSVYNYFTLTGKYIDGLPTIIRAEDHIADYDKDVLHTVIRELVDGKIVVVEEYDKPLG